MKTFLLYILLGSLTTSHADRCTLPDVQRTPGKCVHIRDCRYQLGRFRLGLPVAPCGSTKTNVCCPDTQFNSISEKKCNDWREMLYAPPSFTQPRLEKPECADPNQGFVVGGRDARPFEYPHAVSLGYGTDSSKLKFLCGATLISERYLITAAHCVTHQRAGKPTYAILGDTVLDPAKDNDKSSKYRKLVQISNHIVHPNYKPPLIYNDIALLRLSTPLELSRHVMPACVGTPLKTPKKNIQVEACGWGITDAASQVTSNILQSINITTVDSETCNTIYAHEPDKGYRYPNGIMKSQLCATGEDRDTCKGDSGGGLMTREIVCLFHVVGITSIGSKVCGLGTPAVYTTVAAYQDWIESNVWG